jgi:hypothetical protein
MTLTSQPDYKAELKSLIYTALQSPGLLSPNDFNLARYSLNPQARNRLLDPDILALEDYLIDHSGLPNQDGNLALLHCFGDCVREICTDSHTSLQMGYQHMAWLLAWLNTHHLPSFFGEDPDSPLQVLQLAAAVGYGEWAAYYVQVDEGLERLFVMAVSPLWRVRAVAALGLQRMLRHSWERTLRRLQYQALIANSPEWLTILTAFHGAEGVLLGKHPERMVATLHLYHHALQFLGQHDPTPDQEESYTCLLEYCCHHLAAVVQVQPQLGLAQLAAWATWPYPEAKQVVRATLTHLEGWEQHVAWIEAQLT